ncbi:hypothetical protein F511_43789 [Dorcoceras hygrometricum]|nr:hypothetical protein F511_43789 [Dorcoceras hygrometricum]
MDKLHRATKPSGDKTILGYNSDERSTAESNCTPKLEITKLQTINFVKSSMGQPAEAQSGKTKIAAEPPIWKGIFCGLAYTAPKKPRESCINKRIEQLRGKPKSGGRKQCQFSRPSTKDRQYRPRYKKPRSQGQHTAYQNHTRLKNTHGPHKCFDAHTGKWVKIIQVWIPKSLIKPGLK